MKTHYDVLGVPFGADYETIKAAYRKALKVYHPDLHEGDAGAERLSKQIIDAHAVLKDPDQRVLYDEYILHYRQQRRRLFLITLMLIMGLTCGGSLFFLDMSLRSETTTVAPSGRFASADALSSAGGSERVGKTASPSVTAALPPSQMSDARSYMTVAPVPPADAAEAESPADAAPLPPGEMDIRPSAAIVPTPPTGIAEVQSTSAPAEPSSSEKHDAPSDVTVVPTPPKGFAEPAHEVTAVPPAEKSTPAVVQQETAWADVDKRANAEDVLKFIRDYPETPTTALRETPLQELIETRAASKEVIAGALPDETGEAPQSEIQPRTAMVPTPKIGPPPEETVEQAEGITPRDPKKHVKKGLRLLKAGDHERAITSFTNAILLDPPNAGYYLHRAAAWEAMGNLNNALADYDAAVRLDQTNIATFRARGLLWHRRGDSERALGDLDRAIRLSFSDAKIYRDRGMIWYEMGRYNRAIADFSHAIALDPNLASAYVSRGQAFQKKDDPVTAAINFEKAASRDPVIGKAYRDLLNGPSEKGGRKTPQASR